MKGFDEEYQAKSYYIYHRVVVVSSQKERVRLISTHTHTHIKSDIVLYFKRKIYIYLSNFNDSATSQQQRRASKYSHSTTLIIIIPPNIPRSPPRHSINTRL